MFFFIFPEPNNFQENFPQPQARFQVFPGFPGLPGH